MEQMVLLMVVLMMVVLLHVSGAGGDNAIFEAIFKDMGGEAASQSTVSRKSR